MNSFHFSIQPQPKGVLPFGAVPSQSTIVGLFLFLLFAFTLIVNLCKRFSSPQEDSIEVQRQMLERIWNASSSKR